MSAFAWTLAAATVFAAALHVHWGLGGSVPGAGRGSAPPTVTIFAGARLPAAACLALAGLLVVVALLALALAGAFAQPFDRLALAGSAVFAGLAFSALAALRLLLPARGAGGLGGRLYPLASLLMGIGYLTLGLGAFAA